MCSRKCESPASSGSSPREPAPTKKPRAADRTELMCSVTTRSPESSVVSLCSGRALAALGIAVAARAPLAVAVAPSAAAVAARPAAVAVAARPAVAAAAASPPPPTVASSSTVLPATSGSSARRRPMRPRSLSTSTTRTAISSPLLSTSSTVATRWPGETLEMCSRPSVPLASSTNAPNVVVLTTLAVGNSSPTSTSLVIERIRSTSASPCAPVCA